MNDQNNTALSLAIKNHRFEVVALLLQHIKIITSERENLLEDAYAEQQWLQEETIAVKKALRSTNIIIELLKKS